MAEPSSDDWPLPAHFGSNNEERLQSLLAAWKEDEKKRQNRLADAEHIFQQTLLRSYESAGTYWNGTGQKHILVEKEGEMRNFVVGRSLGEGRFGVVKVLTCRSLIMARKKVRARSDNLKDVQNEVEIMEKLVHKHFVKLVGTYTWGSKLYILTFPVAVCTLEAVLDEYQSLQSGVRSTLDTSNVEAVARATLGTARSRLLLEKGSEGIDELVIAIGHRLDELLGCLATGVEWMHAQNVRHLDLKPSNIVLNPGELYITDFGLSRDFDERSSTETELHGGLSYGYAAPEIHDYEAYRPSSADIYSLGCIFLHVATVRHGGNRHRCKNILKSVPIKPTTRETEIQAYLTELWPRSIMAEMRGGNDMGRLPLGFLDLLRRMLANEAAQRPSASMVNDSLRQQGDRVQRYHGACCKKNLHALSLIRCAHDKYSEAIDDPQDSLYGYLALKLHELQSSKEEEQALRDGFERSRLMFGQRHPRSIDAARELVVFLQGHGRHDEAKTTSFELLRRMEVESEHVYLDPPALALMRNSARLAALCQQHEEAEVLLRRVLGLSEKIMGRDHPETLESVDDLATFLTTQGKYVEAEAVCRDSVSRKKGALGKDYFGTLDAMHSLSIVLSAQGKYTEAENLAVKTLRHRTKVLSRNHPDILANLAHLAMVLEKAGKQQAATDIIGQWRLQTQKVKTRICGEGHFYHRYIQDRIKELRLAEQERENVESLPAETVLEAEVLDKVQQFKEQGCQTERPVELWRKFSFEAIENAEAAEISQEFVVEPYSTPPQKDISKVAHLKVNEGEPTDISEQHVQLSLDIDAVIEEATLWGQGVSELLSAVVSTATQVSPYLEDLEPQINSDGGKDTDTPSASNALPLEDVELQLNREDGTANGTPSPSIAASSPTLAASTPGRTTLAILEGKNGMKGLPLSPFGIQLTLYDSDGSPPSAASSPTRAAGTPSRTTLAVLEGENGMKGLPLSPFGIQLALHDSDDSGVDFFTSAAVDIRLYVRSKYCEAIKGRPNHCYPDITDFDAIKQFLLIRPRSYLSDHSDEAAHSHMLHREFNLAENLFQRSLAAKTPWLGEKDVSTLQTMHFLGTVLYMQSKYQDAEKLLRSAVTLSTQILGKRHSRTLASLCLLGCVCGKQLDSEGAEKIFEEVLQAHNMELLGNEHYITVCAKDGLIEALLNQNKFNDLEWRVKEALKHQKAALGDKHPSTIRTVHNLARVLENTGQIMQAEDTYRQAWSLSKEVLGDENLDTLDTTQRLGSFLLLHKKYEDAELVLREELWISSALHGPKSLQALQSMYRLGTSLWEQDKVINSADEIISFRHKHEEAEKLIREVTSQRGELLGKLDPVTLASTHTLANILKGRGKLVEAENTYMWLYGVRERTLGRDHPDTLAAKRGFVAIRSMEKKTVAESIYRESQEADLSTTKSLGFQISSPQNADELQEAIANNSNIEINTTTVLPRVSAKDSNEKQRTSKISDGGSTDDDTGLADVLQRLSVAKEGKEQQMLKVKEWMLLKGAREHPETMDYMHERALTLEAHGRLKEAETVARQTLMLRSEILGHKHPDTLESMQNLALLLKKRGADDEAKQLLTDLLVLKAHLLGGEDPETMEVRSTLDEFQTKRRSLRGRMSRFLRSASSIADLKALGNGSP